MIGHPFQVFPFEIYWKVFLAFLTPTLLLTGIFAVIPLQPNMLQFELNAEEVIAQWTPADKIRAGFSLGLDFLYLVVYSTTISLACIWASNLLKSSSLLLASVGIYLAWGQWLAALFDAVENIALVRILLGSPTKTLSKVARTCAITKFTLVLLGLVYAAIGGVFWLI
jgi:hypothetical protein